MSRGTLWPQPRWVGLKILEPVAAMSSKWIMATVRYLLVRSCHSKPGLSFFLQDDSETAGLSDWDRYAAEHYEILLAEEAYEQENE